MFSPKPRNACGARDGASARATRNDRGDRAVETVVVAARNAVCEKSKADGRGAFLS